MKKFLFYLLAVYWVLSAGFAQAGTIKGTAKIQGKQDHKNVVVYVDGVKGNFKLPAKRPEMNHVDVQFKPSVLPVLKGTTVDFPNSDPIFHSAFSESPSNPFDLGLYGQGKEKFVKMENSGVVELFCHIHSHMHAFILVLDSPFFTVTDENGNFTLEDVPDGSYTLKAWVNPSVEVAKSITVSGDQIVNMDFTLVAGR